MAQRKNFLGPKQYKGLQHKRKLLQFPFRHRKVPHKLSRKTIPTKTGYLLEEKQ